MFNCDLWRTSGHYENYKEHMFLMEVEKKEFGLKPMNCPGLSSDVYLLCVWFGV